MPLSGNLTPAGSTPEKSTTTPHQYRPERTAPGVGINVPIAGQPGPAPRQAEEPAPEGQEGDGGDKDKATDTGWRLGLIAQKDAKARERIAQARQLEERLKAMEERLNEREAALKGEDGKRTEWRRNPASLLRDHGYDPQAALQFMLNGERLTPDQQLAVNVQQSLERQDAKTEERIAALRKEEDDRRAEEGRQDDERRQKELQEQEAVAFEELRADIGFVVEQDAGNFPLVTLAGDRGVEAILGRVSDISDQMAEQHGRRPPLSTKLLERAAAEIEKEAREEIEKANERLGIRAAPAPRVPQTLTNRIPRSTPSNAPPAGETEMQKRERVKSMIEPMLRGGRAR